MTREDLAYRPPVTTSSPGSTPPVSLPATWSTRPRCWPGVAAQWSHMAAAKLAGSVACATVDESLQAEPPGHETAFPPLQNLYRNRSRASEDQRAIREPQGDLTFCVRRIW